MQDGDGCFVCGARVDGSAATPRALRECLSRAVGSAAPSPDKGDSSCEGCRDALTQLHEAEAHWRDARDRLLRLLGRPPTSFTHIKTELNVDDDTEAEPEFCRVGGDASPDRHCDSDDEPLYKCKVIAETRPSDDETEPNSEITDELKFSCRECDAEFKLKPQLVAHMYAVHNLQLKIDPNTTISKGNEHKKRRKSQRKGRKNTSSAEEDDEDWIVPLKKSKIKKSTSSGRVIRNSTDTKENENIGTKRKNSNTNEFEIKLVEKFAAANVTIKRVPYSHLSGSNLPAVGTCSNHDDRLLISGPSNDDAVLNHIALKFSPNLTFHTKKKDKKQKMMFSCSDCPATFSSQVRLDFHKCKVGASKGPFICEICGASYKHKKACDIHVGMHKGISPWKCAECNKIFPSKGALSRHEAIHTGIANYQCDLCGKSFIHTSSFKMHKLSHSGVKPHTCSKCGLSLMTRSHLKRHQRVHSGEKRHECDICGKKFSERYNLYAHQKSHNASDVNRQSKNHDCTACDATFNRRHLLDKHMETVHQRVIEGGSKKPRNTMSKLIKHSIQVKNTEPSTLKTEPQNHEFKTELVQVKVSLSPPPCDNPPTITSNIPFSSVSNTTSPTSREETIINNHNHINIIPGSNYQLANDYPLRMYGVDYAGYLNRQ